MADLKPPPKGLPASFYWGGITAAGYAGENTQQLYARLNRIAQNAGFSSIGVSSGAISKLRSQAVALRRASNELMASSMTSTVTGAMIGRPINARPLGGEGYIPRYTARYESRELVGGEVRTEWRFVEFGSMAPRTVNDVYAAIAEAAESGTGSPQGPQVGIGRITIEET